MAVGVLPPAAQSQQAGLQPGGSHEQQHPAQRLLWPQHGDQTLVARRREGGGHGERTCGRRPRDTTTGRAAPGRSALLTGPPAGGCPDGEWRVTRSWDNLPVGRLVCREERDRARQDWDRKVGSSWWIERPTDHPASTGPTERPRDRPWSGTVRRVVARRLEEDQDERDDGVDAVHDPRGGDAVLLDGRVRRGISG